MTRDIRIIEKANSGDEGIDPYQGMGWTTAVDCCILTIIRLYLTFLCIVAAKKLFSALGAMIVESQTAFRATLDRLSLLAIILMMGMPGVSAQTTAPTELQGKYLRTDFSSGQGLSSDQVDDIAQALDGSLWLRLGYRLNRFDGQHVDAFPKLSPVNHLAIAPNGDLWIGGDFEVKQIPAKDLHRFSGWSVATYRLCSDCSI